MLRSGNIEYYMKCTSSNKSVIQRTIKINRQRLFQFNFLQPLFLEIATSCVAKFLSKFKHWLHYF